MALYDRQCKRDSRISKQTVLAMLRSPSVIGVSKGEQVQWTDSNGVTKTYRVDSVGQSEVALELNGEVLTVSKSEVNGQSSTRTILDKLNREDWTIDSFDPSNRVVCITINTPIRSHKLSITLPNIDFSVRNFIPGQR